MAEKEAIGKKVYWICTDDECFQSVIDVITTGKLAKCIFYKSAKTFDKISDSIDVKRKIFESDFVIAEINQQLMDSNQMQYELAVAQDMKKDIIVLRHLVDLPKAFNVSPILDLDILDTPNLADILEKKISPESPISCETGRFYQIVGLYYLWMFAFWFLLTLCKHACRQIL